MFKSLDNIGENTINKIAEVAFASQMQKAKKLSVKVDITPEQLSKGIVNSLMIQGQEIITHSNLSLQQVHLQIDEIGVYPFKALMGNIQLTQPTQGTATILLSRQDLKAALDLADINQELQHYDHALEVERIDCQVTSENFITVTAAVNHQNSHGKHQAFAMILKPITAECEQEVIFKPIIYACGEEFQASLGQIVQQKLASLLNLNGMCLEGVSLKVETINIHAHTIRLDAIAYIDKFPAKK